MKKLLILFAVVIALYACKSNGDNSSSNTDSGKYKISDLKENSNNIQIVDLRSVEEYNSGRIPNSINLNPNDINAIKNRVFADLPVCLYGKDAEKTAELLKKDGFKHVGVLEGGIEEWTKNKLTIEKLILYDNDTIPFEEAIKGNKLVMVDFNATWCRPCKMIEPFVHSIRENRASEVIVYGIDVDQHPDLSIKYKADRIPLIVFIKNNKELYRSEGVVSENKLNDLVDKYK